MKGLPFTASWHSLGDILGEAADCRLVIRRLTTAGRNHCIFSVATPGMCPTLNPLEPPHPCTFRPSLTPSPNATLQAPKDQLNIRHEHLSRLRCLKTAATSTFDICSSHGSPITIQQHINAPKTTPTMVLPHPHPHPPNPTKANHHRTHTSTPRSNRAPRSAKTSQRSPPPPSPTPPRP